MASGPREQQYDDLGAPKPGAPRSSYFGVLTQALNVIGTVLILAMGVAINLDVGGRNLFNHPVPGVLEFLGLSIVAILFLQMANTLREHRHISNDILMQLIVKSHPQLTSFLYALFNLLGAMMMLLITWFVWPILVDYYNNGYFRGTAGLVQVPIWPFISAVIIGAGVTTIQYVLHAWSNLKDALRAEPR